MTQEIIFQYLGKNGIICSPVEIEGVYSIKKIKLIADEKKTLTKDNVNFAKAVVVPEDEIVLWKEVKE